MDCSAWRKLSLEERGLLMIAFSCLAKARSEGRTATVEDVAHYSGCRVATAHKLLAKLVSSGYLVVVNCQLSSNFFDKMQKSKDQTLAERSRRYRDSKRCATDEQRVAQPVEDRREKKEAEVDRDTNVSLVPAVQKAKAIKVQEQLPEVAFDPSDEDRVTALILAHAPSGRVQPKTIARLRSQYREKLDAVGLECWRYGIDVALAKPAGWPYALTVMLSNPNGAPASRSPSNGKQERYIPKNLRPNEDLIAQLEELGRRNGVFTK